MELLRLENIGIYAHENGGNIQITNDVSFSLESGKTMGIIGESGCGKSITALSIMNLTSKHIKIDEGKLYFKGECISQLSPKELRKLCGSKIGMVFQEPMTALNPVFTIEQQMADPIRLHLGLAKNEIHARCVDLLTSVGIKDPEGTLKCYPHQLSGGMRQRVVIAMAISCGPELLIADEPTTALDVTIQLQILYILKKLIRENNMSLLIISHDMGVISMLSETIAVMYAGEIVEQDTRENIMSRAAHPYTAKLINAARELNTGCEELTVVEGSVPRPGEKIKGCKFAERCEFACQKCFETHPSLEKKPDGKGMVRCWKYTEKQEAGYVRA